MKALTANELRKLYIDFFVSKGHKQISGASLIPENDPTVLFTTAGMHPLVPYILGAEHPAGKMLVDYQKCIRTGDIDSVGDPHHLTFFEMLGNWSLGAYFKKEAIRYSYEFLTKYLEIDPEKLSVTVFAGDENAPRDDEAAEVWKSLGIPEERIYFMPKEDNWWGPAGETGPCGPDSEMFIDTGRPACGPDCKPGCSCGKYFEIWNDVFMGYRKDENGAYNEMERKCIDTGMGIERTIAILQGKKATYLYSAALLSHSFAKALYHTAEDNDVATFVDVVRTESSTYPRPLGIDSLMNPPYLWSPAHTREVFAKVQEAGSFKDIHETHASNGRTYYYSDIYLSEAQARSLAEWYGVEQQRNP